MPKQEIPLLTEETSYLMTFLERESFRIKRLPEAQKNSRESLAILGIRAKLINGKNLNRVELRALEKMIQNFVLMTRTQTLPEYDRRITAYPEAAVRYQPYIEKTERELELVEGLLEKVRGAL